MKNITKKCSKCGRELPLECFGKNKSRKDGLQPYCKECKKQYYVDNAEYLKQYKKQWYAEHRDERIEKMKQYYVEHRDECIEKMKQYHADNADAIKEYKKQYYADNADAIKQHKKQYYTTIEGYTRSIRHHNLQEDRKHGRCGKDEDPLPPHPYYIEKFSEGIDYYDGKKYPFNELGFDRIDDNLPHTIDNIVLATTEHNIDRWHKRMTVEEYREYTQKQNEELGQRNV